jgi:hypothetical protein
MTGKFKSIIASWNNILTLIIAVGTIVNALVSCAHGTRLDRQRGWLTDTNTWLHPTAKAALYPSTQPATRP